MVLFGLLTRFHLFHLLLLFSLYFHLLQFLAINRHNFRGCSDGRIRSTFVNLLLDFLQFVALDVPIILIRLHYVVQPQCCFFVFLSGKTLIRLELSHALIVTRYGAGQYYLSIIVELGIIEFCGEVDVVLQKIFVYCHRKHIPAVLLPADCQGRMHPLLAYPSFQKLFLSPRPALPLRRPPSSILALS